MQAGRSLGADPERQLALRHADQAREDFAAIESEQLSRVSDRAWLSRMLLISFCHRVNQ
jgi:hypothetical protein